MMTNTNTEAAMQIHQTVRNLAIRHNVNVRRDHNGYYFARIGEGVESSNWIAGAQPTAQSGLAVVRKAIRFLGR